ncbi:MAG: hypothetical protein EAX96_21015 [Candidatus Lokiarchaeota archaeon]|nr:hypothetical protein [Candidatus Lokiarchaeota archaeon]
MKEKKHLLLAVILGLLIFSLAIFSPVRAYQAAPVTDSEDDVYRENLSDPNDNATGNYADNIDITTITRSGQTITINFQSTWPSGTTSTASCMIYIDVTGDELYDYVLYWIPEIPLTTLTNVVVLFGSSGYWSGSGWTYYITSAASVGSASGSSIISTIPSGAFTVQSSDTYLAVTSMTDATYLYEDTSPVSSPPPSNNAPELSEGSVTPSYGMTSTTFTYYVTYSDVDNDAPMYVRVAIDGLTHDMSKVNPGDTTYTDGCQYQYSTTLSASTHNYYFSTSDGSLTDVLPSSGSFPGPEVTSPPTTSTLLYGQVSPTTGYKTTVFNYTVTYFDPTNAAPLYMKVYINNQSFNMLKADPSDSSFDDGVSYYYETTLNTNNNTYRFEASNATHPIKYPADGSNLTGPEVLDEYTPPTTPPIPGFGFVFVLIGISALISIYLFRRKNSIIRPEI